ncbi:ABC transporter substrate-binding protein [Dactylosporangium sp. NPDC000244]|uniref:ABC transporter substrate-binding protein n=1 Tax=Dactylosporangium sp. NPDC000244 TaxID=3154365 RepID=UPI003325245E
MKKGIGLLVLGLALTGLAACGDDKAGGDGKIGGEITVLTQRTDIVNTVFADYKKTFEAKYPGTTVKFEAITDYEGEVRVRMNTKNYGDVLLIPNSVNADQLKSFFEPLGTVEELQSKYRFVRNEQTYDGKVYGLSITGNAQGYVLNKKVWAQAGITEPPKTPEEFLAALKAVKDKTGAIPLYTNYKDGWPLGQWEGARGAISGDPDAAIKLGEDDAPWAAGKEHFVIDSLLYDAVKAGLTEPDPTTTNWEQSKGLLGTGKIATMMLGSWSIVQMQQAATSKDDIGYWPFPHQTNGKFYSVIGGDYKNAININSKNKATARAWIDWFTDESGYATDQGGVSTLKSAAMPATLADLTAAKTELIELNPAPKGQEGRADKIGNSAEIALYDGKYRQAIVDAARGAKNESKDQIFADLNKKWSAARAKLK